MTEVDGTRSTARMRPPAPASLAVLVLLAATGAGAYVAPELGGRLPVTKAAVGVPARDGGTIAADLWMSAEGVGRPLVVLRHGFARSKANMARWGRHFASRGWVAVTPTSRSGLLAVDYERDANDLVDVVDWVAAADAGSGAPAPGVTDLGRVAVAGHSAGATVATLAAARDARIGALVLLDPVDNGGRAARAAAALAVPAVALFAEPALCNAFANGAAIFAALGGPSYGVAVHGADHCDPEWPSGIGCALACAGDGWDLRHSLRFRRYATAFLEAYLGCEPAAYPWVGGDAAAGDAGVTVLPGSRQVAMPPAGCVPPHGR